MKQIEIEEETQMYVKQQSNGLRWCFGQISRWNEKKKTENTAAATVEQQRGGKQINYMWTEYGVTKNKLKLKNAIHKHTEQKQLNVWTKRSDFTPQTKTKMNQKQRYFFMFALREWAETSEWMR